MRVHRLKHIFGWLIGLVSGAVLCSPVYAQREIAAEPYPEAVALDTDTTAIKKLGATVDFLKAKEWQESIETLRQISEQHGSKLVAASPGRYVSVEMYCHMLLASLPAEGLKVYRQRVDPQVREWFEAGQARRDEELLQKVLRHGFLSSYGDDALSLLGELAWERGELAIARSYWRKLLPLGRASEPGVPAIVLSYPDAEVDVALIRARLILCSLLQGHLPRAKVELEKFRQVHPQSQGTLAGQTGLLAEILANVLTEMQQTPFPPPNGEITTFGAHPQRHKVLPKGVDLGAERWSVPLIEPRVEYHERELDLFERPLNMQAVGLPCVYPVVFGDVVLYCDEFSIYAYHLHSESPYGQPAWPADEVRLRSVIPQDTIDRKGTAVPAGERADLGRRPQDPRPSGQGSERPAPAPAATLLPRLSLAAERELIKEAALFSLPVKVSPLGDPPLAVVPRGPRFRPPGTMLGQTIGIPRFTLTVDAGRVYARLGAISTWRLAADVVRSHPQSYIVCLDLTKGGKLLWQINSDEVESDGGAWSFEGTPAVVDGRAYVALRRENPRLQTNVACFDAETGRLLWNRKICQGAEPLNGDIFEISRNLLTVADGRVFYNTNLGCIAALDAQTGTTLWVTTYPHLEADSVRQFNRRQKHGPNPCLYHAGIVYATPYDSDHVIALDAETGLLRWETELKGHARALLGVGQGRLIVAGDHLWGLDADTGHISWCELCGTADGSGYGRGLLVDQSVYWPRREDILVVNQLTGQRQQMPIELRELRHQKGGNLIVAKDSLLIAQTDRLVAFANHGLPRKRFSDDLLYRPVIPLPRPLYAGMMTHREKPGQRFLTGPGHVIPQ